MFLIIVNQIIKMLLLMLVGCLCYRLKLIDEQGNKTLANILLMVINPVLAVTALQTDYNSHLVSGLLMAYLLAVVTQVGVILISTALVKKTGNPDYAIERFSCTYANCGFIGIPLIQSVLGNEGVLYLTAYITVFNLLSWTQGVALMTGKTSKKDIKKGLLSPMVIACVLGLILFFGRIRFPKVLADTLDYIGGMNTPLAMIIAGVSVAQTDLLKMLRNKSVYFASFIKLLVVPAFTLCILTLFHVDKTVAYTILIASACPAAATCTMFALRFQKNYRYASEIYAFSTICSLVTIPLFVYAAERLLV